MMIKKFEAIIISLTCSKFKFELLTKHKTLELYLILEKNSRTK